MNNANEAAGASMAASGTVATGSGALHDLEHHGKLGIFRLVASVITLILGAGVFTLSGDQAAHGANGAAILDGLGHLGRGRAVPGHDVFRAVAP